MKLWVARDTQGSLTLHYIKPEPWAGCGWNGGIPMWLESDMFPEVTFENSPQEVELKLIKDNYGYKQG